MNTNPGLSSPESLPLVQILRHGREVEITPSLATRILNECRFHGQRQLREWRIAYHVGEMKAGRFKQGRQISFALLDGKLILINGYHRMTAVVRCGKLLKNLPELRQVGFQANRRLLDVQTVSHDCSIGEDAFDQVVRPIEVDGQRAAALRFGDARVQALLSVLVLFSFQLRGFTNQEMRALLAQLLGLDPAHYPLGRMTYDLRRLRLHGLIERIPKSHRYQVTGTGLRIALFFTRTYARLLRPKLAKIMSLGPPANSSLRAAFDRVQAEIERACRSQKLVA